MNSAARLMGACASLNRIGEQATEQAFTQRHPAKRRPDAEAPDLGDTYGQPPVK